MPKNRRVSIVGAMKWVDIEQRTDAWFKLRCGKVTGSQWSKVMAHCDKDKPFFGNPALALAEKIAKERRTGIPIIDEGIANANITNGILLEPVAVRRYEEEKFIEVGPGGFHDCGNHGASPDGTIYSEGVLEVKVGIESVHRKRIKRGKIDSAYKWQTTAELYAAQLCNKSIRYLDFVGYCHELGPDENIVVFRLKTTDQDFIQMVGKMERRLVEFERIVADNIERSRWI